ncbi:MAG: class I SAM-dependent methyltransferase [Candidatus Eremiobacteraeota bacterium]|nr:class I SAM-dependent methyltransferase [Candidatus Eremiobacteraeota bacterium]
MDPTQRFGERAGAYAAHRPSYPSEAVDIVLAGLGDPHALTIADLGAGTGISSRLLSERGSHVIAIEPNAKMRAAAGLDAGIEWRDGTGEATGLPASSVHLAAAFQAFHWFATPAGMAEMRRIATRRAALVQYERNARDPFTAAYGDIVEKYALDDTEDRRAAAMRTFAAFPGAAISRADFPSNQRLDLEGLLGRAASSSYLPQSGNANKSMIADLRGLFALCAKDKVVVFEMTTYVITADFGAA